MTGTQSRWLLGISRAGFLMAGVSRLYDDLEADFFKNLGCSFLRKYPPQTTACAAGGGLRLVFWNVIVGVFGDLGG